jgi:hypothetical protein
MLEKKKSSLHKEESFVMIGNSCLKTYASSSKPFGHYLRIFELCGEWFFQNDATRLFALNKYPVDPCQVSCTNEAVYGQTPAILYLTEADPRHLFS